MYARPIAGILYYRVYAGRLGLPMWAVLFALALLAAATGQALGPVLAGSVSATQLVTVSQTIRLAAAPEEPPAGTFVVEGATLATKRAVDFAATINDEKTAFRVAAVVGLGLPAAFQLALANPSGKEANFVVEIAAPPGLHVELSEIPSSDITQLARMGPNAWLGTLASPASANATPDLIAIYWVTSSDAPGPFSLTATISQVSH